MVEIPVTLSDFQGYLLTASLLQAFSNRIFRIDVHAADDKFSTLKARRAIPVKLRTSSLAW